MSAAPPLPVVTPARTSKPRVLEVLYSYRMGGSETLAARLAKALQARGVEVATCSLHTEKGVISDDLEKAGIDCHAFDLEHRSKLGKLLFPLQLYRYLKRHRFDVMHVHHIFVLRHCYRAARLAGIRRIVVTEHSDHEFRGHAGLRRDGHYFGNRADAVTVIHRGMGDYFQRELGVGAERIELIHNSVDTTLFRPGPDGSGLRATLGLADDGIVLGWVGRFHEAKDVGTLLRAFAVVVTQAERPVALVMAGDGEDAPMARALAAQLGIADRVHFLGPRNDIPPLMRDFDLYVSSSYKEGVPLVLLEAMASGLPCVATDVGGVADIVSRESGVVVPPKAPDLLAQAMLRLVEDDRLRERMGRAALIEANRHFRFDTMVDRFMDVLGLRRPETPVVEAVAAQ